jgi:biopolymer transport protein ExbB
MDDTTFGLRALWAQSDPVTKSTLVILSVTYLLSWYLILTKLWDQAVLKRSAKTVEKVFWYAPSLMDGVKRLKERDVFRNIAEDSVRAAAHYQARLKDRIGLHEWVTIALQRSVDVENRRLSAGIALLDAIGSTAPLVGLFGTVWLINRALIVIGLGRDASLGELAGPIAQALMITAFGLFVAVPAAFGYKWLLRRNTDVLDVLRGFTSDLHAYLLTDPQFEKQAPPDPDGNPKPPGEMSATPA